MLPSWFAKLRDVKSGSKQRKKQVEPHRSPPLPCTKRLDSPEGLAKSFSLHRASSKARSGPFEREIVKSCRSEDNAQPFISCSQPDLGKRKQNVSDSVLHEEVTGALLLHKCTIHRDGCQAKCPPQVKADVKKGFSWGDDVKSIANRRGNNMSNFLPDGESQAATHKVHVVSDTETEEFAFSSETSSTFSHEASSQDSSMSSKCSTSEEFHQSSQIWEQDAGLSECMRSSTQESCNRSLDTEETNDEKSSSGCQLLTSRIGKGAAENFRSSTLHELQRTLFSSSIFINGGRDGSSSETRNRTESSSSLIERNEDGSRSRLEGDEGSALLNNYGSGQQRADWKMPLVFGGTRKMNANSDATTSELSGEKRSTSTSDDFSLAIARSSLQEEGEAPHSFVEIMDITTGITTPCAHRMKVGEISPSKYSSVHLQRRRQRGASISAVLPPDLQGVVGDSLAFVKISNDPYDDFQQSMYEMIMEKNLEGSSDVEELLYCYLTLNSPEHHELIEEVFSDVWSAILMTMR